MASIAWEDATRATLFVRDDLPRPARRSIQTTVSRLERIVSSGALEECSVTSWAKRVPRRSEAATGAFERDLYRRFSEWAGDAGVRLGPSFGTRSCYSSRTGQRRTEIVLPAVCLACYDDEELLAVAPHEGETGSVSVADALDALATDGSEGGSRVGLTTAD